MQHIRCKAATYTTLVCFCYWCLPLTWKIVSATRQMHSSNACPTEAGGHSPTHALVETGGWHHLPGLGDLDHNLLYCGGWQPAFETNKQKPFFFLVKKYKLVLKIVLASILHLQIFEPITYFLGKWSSKDTYRFSVSRTTIAKNWFIKAFFLKISNGKD